jgi:hypothetical protein
MRVFFGGFGINAFDINMSSEFASGLQFHLGLRNVVHILIVDSTSLVSVVV